MKVFRRRKTFTGLGVMLPFMAEGLNTSKGNKGNQFILDLYQGISEAVADINKEKEYIKLYAFDTQQR